MTHDLVDPMSGRFVTPEKPTASGDQGKDAESTENDG